MEHVALRPCACILILSLAMAGGSAQAGIVYSNDFQVSAGAEWSESVISSTPLPTDGSRKFLGPFGPADGMFGGTSDVTLTLSGLPEHDSLTIEFDLYIMQSWDGNFPIDDPFSHGPDTWSFSISGDATLLYTTFNNQPFYFDAQYPNQSQSFSGLEDTQDDTYSGDIETTPKYPGQTGSVEAGTLGYTTEFADIGEHPTSSVYHLSFDRLHSSNMIQFQFSSAVRGYEGDPPDPERWGVDNIVLTVDSEPTPVHVYRWGRIKALYR